MIRHTLGLVEFLISKDIKYSYTITYNDKFVIQLFIGPF